MTERQKEPPMRTHRRQSNEASAIATTSATCILPQIPESGASTSPNTSPRQTPTQILGPMLAVAYKWRNFHLLHALEVLLAKWERRTLWPTTTD